VTRRWGRVRTGGRRARPRFARTWAVTGSVIVLNGPSSAGKSTLAAALQRRFAAEGKCWFVYALDEFLGKVPFDWVAFGSHLGAHAGEGVAFEMVDGRFHMRLGPVGRGALAAWRGAVGCAARAGLNVIADEVVLTRDDWRAWQVELDGVDVHWVGVTAAPDVLGARERARSNRLPGQARAQYETAYRYPAYDSEVDTGQLDPDAAATAVLAAWRARAG
jgi:chloramphenicol 3-O phosphotransferase